MAGQTENAGGRFAFLAYGLVVYLIFVATFAYAAGFVGDIVVPKSIDAGQSGPVATAILINALLLGLFAAQHAIMARPAFKAWWTRVLPQPTERSTFVLVTCAVLCLMFWQWRAMPEVVWSVHNPVGVAILHGLYALGWVLVLYASFCIDHFDLFGVRQVVLFWQGKEYTHPGFATPWLYKLVRNPLMLGFLIAFWSTPHMTQGHLLFSVMTTGYIFFGVWLEERDLLANLGEDYRRYRERTPMLLPLPRRAAAVRDSVAEH